jgi:hypothetical protein
LKTNRLYSRNKKINKYLLWKIKPGILKIINSTMDAVKKKIKKIRVKDLRHSARTTIMKT